MSGCVGLQFQTDIESTDPESTDPLFITIPFLVPISSPLSGSGNHILMDATHTPSENMSTSNLRISILKPMP